MKKVRWGVLSTAKIATEKVLPSMQQGQFCDIVAMGSRDLGRAQKAAQNLGIPKAYGSYEELLQDPEIDAIYNPLPNHLHVPWTIRALEAGKHVLCEKPIALSSEEAQSLVDTAAGYTNLKVMEAFMYRHHEQWKLVRELVDSGKIGQLRTIQTMFSYFNDDPANIRNQADIGGGGLMDIGCYAISLSRFVFATEPTRVVGIIDYDPQMKTDRVASAVLEFDQGTSTFTCGTQLSSYQRVNIHGTEGRVEIEIPFNAPIDRPCRMWHQFGSEIEELELAVCDQYMLQGDLFSQAVLNDTPVPTPLEDAVHNMRVLEAIVRSHSTGKWESPLE